MPRLHMDVDCCRFLFLCSANGHFNLFCCHSFAKLSEFTLPSEAVFLAIGLEHTDIDDMSVRSVVVGFKLTKNVTSN